MSVCLSQQRLSGKDAGCLWSEGRLQRMTRRRGARRELRRACALVMARLVGALGAAFCTALCRGAVFCCALLHCPLKGNVVFSPCLDVAVGQVGGHKRKYAAMMQSSSRASVKVSKLSLLLGALFLSLVVGVLGLDFRGMALVGASRRLNRFNNGREKTVSSHLRNLGRASGARVD